MIMILHAVVAEQFLPYFFLFVGVVARFCGFVVDGIYAMGFFTSAVSTLKTVNWTYVNATVSGTMETSIVEKADKVYFFTDTISHSTYFRYSNVVKERNVPFGYIHGVNIENVTKQLYRELKE